MPPGWGEGGEEGAGGLLAVRFRFSVWTPISIDSVRQTALAVIAREPLALPLPKWAMTPVLSVVDIRPLNST